MTFNLSRIATALVGGFGERGVQKRYAKACLDCPEEDRVSSISDAGWLSWNALDFSFQHGTNELVVCSNNASVHLPVASRVSETQLLDKPGQGVRRHLPTWQVNQNTRLVDLIV